jgi:hypothetical protein
VSSREMIGREPLILGLMSPQGRGEWTELAPITKRLLLISTIHTAYHCVHPLLPAAGIRRANPDAEKFARPQLLDS